MIQQAGAVFFTIKLVIGIDEPSILAPNVDYTDIDASHSVDFETRILVLQIVLAMGNIIAVSLTQVAAWENGRPKFLVPWLVVVAVQIVIMLLSACTFLISFDWQLRCLLDLICAGKML